MQIKISTFAIELYERVFKLWKQSDGVGLGDSDSKENIEFFLERNPGLSFVAELNGELVGVVLAGHDGRRGYIHHLAVSASHRGKGTGRFLVDRCLGGLKAAGILKCHIFMFNNNYIGQKFWESIGWSHRNDICVISKLIDPPCK